MTEKFPKPTEQQILLDNDDFATPITLNPPAGIVQGSNIGASSQQGEPAHRGMPAEKSVWYRWQAPPGNNLAIFIIANSDFDSRLAAYMESGTGNNFNILCETGIFANLPASKLEIVAFQAEGGQAYRLAVDGVNGDSGQFTLRWAAAPNLESLASLLIEGLVGGIVIKDFLPKENVTMKAGDVNGIDPREEPTDILGLYLFPNLDPNLHPYKVTPCLVGHYFWPTSRMYASPVVSFLENYVAYSSPIFGFRGLIEGRVSPDAPQPDGQKEGAFAVDFPSGSGEGQVIELTLTREGGGQWSTNQQNGSMILAAAPSVDADLLNDETGAVSFPISDGTSIVLFASDDPNSSLFTPGSEFTLTIKFADERQPKVSITIEA